MSRFPQPSIGPPRLGERMNPFTSFWLNSIVESPIVHWRIRSMLLRLSGIRGRKLRVLSGVRWAGSRDVTFEDGVFVNTGVLFDAGAPIVVGAHGHISHDARLITATHEIGPAHRRCGDVSFLPVTIGKGVWIGASATVLAGVSVGDGCIIAAGAVVADDCDPNGLYAGVPARRIRNLDDSALRRLAD